jgi:HEAT repeat protein
MGGAKDPEGVWRIRYVLAEIGERTPKENDRENRRAAAICAVLGEIGDPSALEALAARAESKEAVLRQSAARALGLLRPKLDEAQADRAAQGLLWMLMTDSGCDAVDRCAALGALERLGSRKATPVLLKLLKEEDRPNDQVRIRALAALGACGGAEALRGVIDTLLSSNPYLRRAALEALRPHAGDDFGFDPLAPASAGAVVRFRTWWSEKFPESPAK